MYNSIINFCVIPTHLGTTTAMLTETFIGCCTELNLKDFSGVINQYILSEIYIDINKFERIISGLKQQET